MTSYFEDRVYSKDTCGSACSSKGLEHFRTIIILMNIDVDTIVGTSENVERLVELRLNSGGRHFQHIPYYFILLIPIFSISLFTFHVIYE